MTFLEHLEKIDEISEREKREKKKKEIFNSASESMADLYVKATGVSADEQENKL